MAVKNFICKECDKLLVCNVYQRFISKFDEDAKNPLPTTIEIKECEQYKKD